MVLTKLIKGVFYEKKKIITYKMSKYTDLIYYQKNREVILNRAKDHYENNKERLKRQARDKYRNLSEKKKNKTENI